MLLLRRELKHGKWILQNWKSWQLLSLSSNSLCPKIERVRVRRYGSA